MELVRVQVAEGATVIANDGRRLTAGDVVEIAPAHVAPLIRDGFVVVPAVSDIGEVR